MIVIGEVRPRLLQTVEQDRLARREIRATGWGEAEVEQVRERFEHVVRGGLVGVSIVREGLPQGGVTV
ncbi:hypothetical protein [Nocardia sp. NPDC004604]|uniref:hypothetical protein n=1 Tax=Nocardia sp. NPDC004604 TaxID=3157013 RepID=UPI0033BE019B